MTALDTRRFLFVTGKGGTGKTTVTAALAVALADRGKRVLISVSDPKERISELFGAAPLGPDITTLSPNIFAVKISPEVALREYGEMILKSRTVYNAVFGNKYVQGFFAAVPGLHQWAILGKAWFHSTEKDPSGRPRFDMVLFDAPATGHGLEMLRVPKIIVDISPPGLLRRDAEAAWTMFKNPAESGVVIVTLPEDMPASESLELAEAVVSELKLPIANVVANQVVEPLFSDAERAELEKPRPLDESQPGDVGVGAAVRRATMEKIQAESLKRIRTGITAELVTLPRLVEYPTNRAAIRALAKILGAALFGEATQRG
jgi:anion-transporting  ArsA/GET3 family ATPase